MTINDSEVLRAIYKMAMDETTEPEFFFGFVGSLARGNIRLTGFTPEGDCILTLTEKGEFDAEKLLKTNPDAQAMLRKLKAERDERRKP